MLQMHIAWQPSLLKWCLCDVKDLSQNWNVHKYYQWYFSFWHFTLGLEASLTKVLKHLHSFVRHLICGSTFLTKLVLSIIICLGKEMCSQVWIRIKPWKMFNNLLIINQYKGFKGWQITWNFVWTNTLQLHLPYVY